MLDTKIGSGKKDDAAQVAQRGFEAMMKGEGDVVTGWQNKLRSAIANILPGGRHRRDAPLDGRAAARQVTS